MSHTQFPLEQMFDHFVNRATNEEFLRGAQDILDQQANLTSAPFLRFDHKYSDQAAQQTALALNTKLLDVYAKNPQMQQRFSFSAGNGHIRLQLGDVVSPNLVEAFAEFVQVEKELQDRLEKRATPKLNISKEKDFGAYLRWAAASPEITPEVFEGIVKEAINRNVINAPRLDGKTALHFALIAGNESKANTLLTLGKAKVDDHAITLANNNANLSDQLKNQLSRSLTMEVPRSSMSFRF